MNHPDMNEDLPIRALAAMCASYAYHHGGNIEETAAWWSYHLHVWHGTSVKAFHDAVMERWICYPQSITGLHRS